MARPRLLLVGAVAMVAIIVPPLAVPAIFTGLVYNAVTRNSYQRRAARREERREARRERSARGRTNARRMGREEARDRAVEYSSFWGYNVSRLPVDMRPDFSTRRVNVRGFSMDFECAGIPGLVKGEGRGKDVVYSFRFGSEDAARRLAPKVKSLGPDYAALEQQKDGSYLVKAYDAVTVNELAKAAFPLERVKAERSVTEERQYLVTGCSSYEEAVKRLRAWKESDPDLSPDRTRVTVSSSVDGVSESKVTGDELFDDKSFIPLGAYVVTEREVTARKGEYQVPSLDKGSEDKRDLVLGRLDGESSVPAKSSEILDGTPEKAGRYLYDDNNRYVALRDGDAVLGMGGTLKAYFVCDSVESLAEVLNRDSLPAGSYLALQFGEPSVGEGRFAVAFDVDGEKLSRLALQGGASPDFAARCESMGVSAQQLEMSLLARDLSSDGYANVVLKEGVPVDQLKVNGLSVRDISARLANDRLVALDSEATGLWIKEAARIQAVNMTVDAKRAELRIETLADNVRRVETRKLTDGEVRGLSARGAISRAEMKDIFMQIHPDMFKSYSFGGKSVFKDPLGDFIAGRKPVTVVEAAAEMKKQRQQSKEKSKGRHMG